MPSICFLAGLAVAWRADRQAGEQVAGWDRWLVAGWLASLVGCLSGLGGWLAGGWVASCSALMSKACGLELWKFRRMTVGSRLAGGCKSSEDLVSGSII